MREFLPSMVLASDLASTVLPVPGKSSSSTWPSESRAVSTSRITCCLPRIAWSTLSTSLPNASANQLACSCVTAMSCRFRLEVVPGLAADRDGEVLRAGDADRDRAAVWHDAVRAGGLIAAAVLHGDRRAGSVSQEPGQDDVVRASRDVVHGELRRPAGVRAV